MAGATLNLPALQALIALGGYGGRGFYDPSTAVLGLSAALFLSDLNIWQGAGDTLTSDEIDDIQEFIAQLEYDLMTTGDMYPIDKCKITSSVPIEVLASTSKTLNWDTELYDPQDMHDLAGNDALMYVVNDGLHLINITVQWEAAAVGYRRIIVSRYRPSTFTTTQIGIALTQSHTGTAPIIQTIAVQDDALAGDYYFFYAYQTSPMPIDVVVTEYAPMFSIVRV